MPKRGKIHVKLIRPEFKTSLTDLIERVYQKPLPNNELRILFARAFAWSHSAKALQNPDEYKVNWASLAAEAYKIGQVQLNKEHVNAFEKNTKSLLNHMRSLNTMLEDSKKELVEKKVDLLRMEGSANSSMACFKDLEDEIKEKRQNWLALELFNPEEEDAIQLIQKEEQALQSFLDKQKSKNNSSSLQALKLSISILEYEIEEYEVNLEYWRAKCKHVAHLHQNHKSKKNLPKIGMGNYFFPMSSDGGSTCEGCGLLFSEDYELHVKLKECGHIYHVICFSVVLESMQCIASGCEAEVPATILDELGFKELKPPVSDDEEHSDESAEEVEKINKEDFKSKSTKEVTPKKRFRDDASSSTSLFNEPASKDFQPVRQAKKRLTRSSTKSNASKPVETDPIDVNKVSPVKFSHLTREEGFQLRSKSAGTGSKKKKVHKPAGSEEIPEKETEKAVDDILENFFAKENQSLNMQAEGSSKAGKSSTKKSSPAKQVPLNNETEIEENQPLSPMKTPVKTDIEVTEGDGADISKVPTPMSTCRELSIVVISPVGVVLTPSQKKVLQTPESPDSPMEEELTMEGWLKKEQMKGVVKNIFK